MWDILVVIMTRCCVLWFS